MNDSLKPTYFYSQTGLTPTAAAYVFGLESGSAKISRLIRLVVTPGTASAAGTATLTLSRYTTAATGGLVTPDNTLNRNLGDAVYSGLVRSTGFTPGGTVTASKWVFPIPTPASSATLSAAPIVIDLADVISMQGFVLPVGVNNGIAFQHSGLAGAAGFAIQAVWTEWVL